MSDAIRVGLIGYGYASKTFHEADLAPDPMSIGRQSPCRLAGGQGGECGKGLAQRS